MKDDKSKRKNRYGIFVLFIFLCVIFFAVLAFAENTYTITYDLNGGRGYAPSVQKTHGVALQITDQDPWKNPMTFMGWSTDPNATAGEYLPKDMFTTDANTTLYAIWRNPFDPGILSDGSQFVVPSYHLGYGPRMYVKIVVDTPGFYCIRTVNTKMSGSWGGEGFCDSNVNYICEFDYLRTEGENSDKSPDLMACTWLNANTVYYFAYMDFSDAEISFKVIRTQDSALQLGCVNGEGEFSTNYSPNRKTSLLLSFTVAEDGYYNIRSTNGDPDDYHSRTNELFTIDTNGQIQPVGDGGWTIDRSNLSVTANLQANETYYLKYFDVGRPLDFLITNEIYTLTYDLNGGRGYAPAVSKLKGETIRITDQDPWKNPMTFMGWNTDLNAEAGQYLPEDLFDVDADTTLYAIWRPAYDPGTLSPGVPFVVPSYHLGYGPRMYIKIQVEYSGYYCIRTLDRKESGSWGGEGFYDENLNYLCDFKRIRTEEEDPNNDSASRGYTDLAAYRWLEAGKLYYYAYMDFDDSDTKIVCNLTKPDGLEADMVLPEGIREIKEEAFQSDTFTSVLIPQGTTSISQNAFADCPNLRKVIILSPNVTIDDDAFQNSTSLTIYGFKDSTAQTFAQQHGFEFKEMGPE